MEFVEVMKPLSGTLIDDIQRTVSKLTLDIICATTFSLDLGAKRGNQRALGMILKNFFGSSSSISFLVVFKTIIFCFLSKCRLSSCCNDCVRENSFEISQTMAIDRFHISKINRWKNLLRCTFKIACFHDGNHFEKNGRKEIWEIRNFTYIF